MMTDRDERPPAPTHADSSSGLIPWRAAWWYLGALAAGTLIISAVVATHAWRIGVPGEWQWPYYAAAASWAVASPAVALSLLLAATVGVCLHHRLAGPRQEALGVGLCMVIALGIILNLGDAGPSGRYETIPRTASPWISGYFAESVFIEDMGGYLENYPERISGLKVNVPFGHLADHPVGPVLFHWVVNRTMETWPWLSRRFPPRDPTDSGQARKLAETIVGRDMSDGAFAGIWASALLYRLAYWLALVPVYFLAREFHSREAGLLALAMTALIPSLHLFGPYPDQIFPLVAVGAFFAWHRAMRSKNMLWAAAAGFLMLVGLLWSLAFLAMVAMLGLAALLQLWREHSAGRNRIAWTAWLRIVLAGVGAFAVCSLLPMVLFGYDVYGVWRICLSQHASFAVLFPRSYVSWMLFNPVEFVLFTGVAVGGLWIGSAVRDARRWWGRRRRGALSVLPWALIGVLAVLNLSGKNLGEVSRLWMFLMPFATVPAAGLLEELDGKRGWAAACMVAAAAVQLVAFRLHLDVLTLPAA